MNARFFILPLREGSTAIKTELATFTLTASEAKGQYRLGL